jgi:hypothetical protein
MPLHNADIAAIFDEIAGLLEIQAANPFRVRTYRNAARIVGELGREIAQMVARGEKLSTLPGIGEDLAACCASSAMPAPAVASWGSTRIPTGSTGSTPGAWRRARKGCWWR